VWKIAATASSSMRNAMELKNSIETRLTTRVEAWFWRNVCAVCRKASACCGTSAASSVRSMSRMRPSPKKSESVATVRVRKGTSDSSALYPTPPASRTPRFLANARRTRPAKSSRRLSHVHPRSSFIPHLFVEPSPFAQEGLHPRPRLTYQPARHHLCGGDVIPSGPL
jgi:hypothetical protein